MGSQTQAHRKTNIVIELRSDVPGHAVDAPIMLAVPETASVREAILSAVRSSSLDEKTKRFLEDVVLGRGGSHDIIAQPRVISQGGVEKAIDLERQVGEVIRSTGSNRIVLHVAPVVGC